MFGVSDTSCISPGDEVAQIALYAVQAGFGAALHGAVFDETAHGAIQALGVLRIAEALTKALAFRFVLRGHGQAQAEVAAAATGTTGPGTPSLCGLCIRVVGVKSALSTAKPCAACIDGFRPLPDRAPARFHFLEI